MSTEIKISSLEKDMTDNEVRKAVRDEFQTPMGEPLNNVDYIFEICVQCKRFRNNETGRLNDAIIYRNCVEHMHWMH